MTDHHTFSPPLLRIQEAPPNPLGQAVLISLLALLTALLIWGYVGQLDIVAVAEGKLVPQSYLKIVQPPDSGIVKEILVKEGDVVQAGQVLMRMDNLITDADAKSLEGEYQRKRLTLRRIDAELGNRTFRPMAGDPPSLVREVESQYRANRSAFEAALAEEKSRYEKARHDASSAEAIKTKLVEVLPYYRDQELAFEKLARDGFAGSIMAGDKKRERIEKEQELKAQEHLLESTRASMMQSEKKLKQIETDYRRQLYAERDENQSAFDKLSQEIAKQNHRQELLELKAPQEAVVKDLSTHTAGTVVQPGTVLLTLVPMEKELRAEVWISNEDAGFVHPGQAVKLKLVAFPFQKYGLAEGEVEHVSADASDNAASNGANDKNAKMPPIGYRALIALKSMHLDMENNRYSLAAGMQTTAEILLGRRSVIEYLLSPVQKAFHEAGRER